MNKRPIGEISYEAKYKKLKDCIVQCCTDIMVNRHMVSVAKEERGFMDYHRRNAVVQLADRMMQDGLIHFGELQDTPEMGYDIQTFRASVWVATVEGSRQHRSELSLAERHGYLRAIKELERQAGQYPLAGAILRGIAFDMKEADLNKKGKGRCLGSQKYARSTSRSGCA